MHMVRFLNLVKSKTDELAVTLQAGVVVGGGPPPPHPTTGSSSSTSSTSKVASSAGGTSVVSGGPDNHAAKKSSSVDHGKAKMHEATEKKELQRLLGESESRLESARKEIEELKAKYNDLHQKNTSRKSLTMLLKTFNGKCIELDHVRDESIRHSIWFTEQTAIQTMNKIKLENKLNEKEQLLQEFKKRSTENEMMQIVSPSTTKKSLLDNLPIMVVPIP